MASAGCCDNYRGIAAQWHRSTVLPRIRFGSFCHQVGTVRPWIFDSLGVHRNPPTYTIPFSKIFYDNVFHCNTEYRMRIHFILLCWTNSQHVAHGIWAIQHLVADKVAQTHVFDVPGLPRPHLSASWGSRTWAGWQNVEIPCVPIVYTITVTKNLNHCTQRYR